MSQLTQNDFSIFFKNRNISSQSKNFGSCSSFGHRYTLLQTGKKKIYRSQMCLHQKKMVPDSLPLSAESRCPHLSCRTFFSFIFKSYQQLFFWGKMLSFWERQASLDALESHFPQPQNLPVWNVPERALAKWLLFSLPLSCRLSAACGFEDPEGETVSRSTSTWQWQERRDLFRLK